MGIEAMMVYKVVSCIYPYLPCRVHPRLLSARVFYSFRPPYGWRRKYLLGRRTIAKPPTGILVFRRLRDALAFAESCKHWAILRGVAGPSVRLPPMRLYGSSGPGDISKLWRGKLDQITQTPHALWPDGTVAVKWFEPQAVVRKARSAEPREGETRG
jgi:hypothetical protein